MEHGQLPTKLLPSSLAEHARFRRHLAPLVTGFGLGRLTRGCIQECFSHLIRIQIQISGEPSTRLTIKYPLGVNAWLNAQVGGLLVT